MSTYVYGGPDDDNNDQEEPEEPFVVHTNARAVHAMPVVASRGLVYRRFIVCFIVNKTTKYIVYKLPTLTGHHRCMASVRWTSWNGT